MFAKFAVMSSESSNVSDSEFFINLRNNMAGFELAEKMLKIVQSIEKLPEEIFVAG